MKKLTLNLMICFAFLSVISTAKAQSTTVYDEEIDFFTDLMEASIQAGSSAHAVILYSQSGDEAQLERAVNTINDDLNEVIDLLGRRRRRIPNATITNQYSSIGNAYRSSSRRIQSDINANASAPEALTELGEEAVTLMSLIKNLAVEIRAELIELRNSNN